MPRARLPSAAFAGSADDIEAAFYEAMQQADADAMMACWSDEDEICCIHPDGPRLVGGAAIRAAYELLFAAGPVRIAQRRLRTLETLGSAVHCVVERLQILTDGGVQATEVLATNVYHKTAQGWRMVLHHASVDRLGGGDSAEAAAGPQTLH